MSLTVLTSQWRKERFVLHKTLFSIKLKNNRYRSWLFINDWNFFSPLHTYTWSYCMYQSLSTSKSSSCNSKCVLQSMKNYYMFLSVQYRVGTGLQCSSDTTATKGIGEIYVHYFCRTNQINRINWLWLKERSRRETQAGIFEEEVQRHLMYCIFTVLYIYCTVYILYCIVYIYCTVYILYTLYILYCIYTVYIIADCFEFTKMFTVWVN